MESRSGPAWGEGSAVLRTAAKRKDPRHAREDPRHGHAWALRSRGSGEGELVDVAVFEARLEVQLNDLHAAPDALKLRQDAAIHEC